MKDLIIIYHGSCRDGFCAAWVARLRYPNATFVPAKYGEAPPDVAGRHVLIVDFSYPRDVMERMATKAKSLLVLDHHKTAEEALAGLPYAQFDMNRSGAGMTWDYLFGGVRPWIVDYVEDRDLWRHKLPHGPAVNAYLGTLTYDFQTWEDAASMSRDQAATLGAVVESKIRQYVIETSKTARRVTFEGFEVPCVNAPFTDISELVGFLANGETFAIGWHQRSDGSFSYSLRSKGDFDVSELAKRYGGGGHKNAAGFVTPKFLF